MKIVHKDPNLPQEELDRRTKRQEAPEDLKQELLKLHQAFNHPPKGTPARPSARQPRAAMRVHTWEYLEDKAVH